VYSSPDILGDQIKEDEVVGTNNMHVNDEKCIQNFSWNT
jgi:hypothetical protein